MATKKKKKQSFSEQVISGNYETSFSKNKVSSSLKKTNASVTKANKQDDRLLKAFDDGYDFGDVTKTILTGGKKLAVGTFNVGKEFVTNPIQTVKTAGVSIASGVDKADTALNNAGNDLLDWILQREDDGKPHLTIKEQARLPYASDEEKLKVLKEYEEAYGKDSLEYKNIQAFVDLKVDKDPNAISNILNPKYYLTDTYKAKEEGELSKGQETIWGVGETIGNMLPSVAVSTVASPLAGSTVFFTQAQQNYTEEAKARGYTDLNARTYGLIMGGAEVLVERLGFDELGGLNKLATGSIKKAMAGEGLEEFVMPYIDSTVKTVGFGEEFDLQGTTEEAIESAVMGAVTGGIMNAGGKGLVAVDRFIEKVNSGQEITQNDLVEAGRELEQTDPNYFNEIMKDVPQVVRDQIQSEDIAPVEQTGQQDIAPVQEVNPKQQNYQYKAQATDSIQRKTISEDASKYANNTKRTQELVDTLVNVSEATGETIRLTNNQSEEMTARRKQLAENYARINNVTVEEATKRFEKTTIDAYNTGKEIVINLDSPKALNRLVGHEVTHSLEGTQEYSKLQRIALDYAKTKGEYNDRASTLQALYEGTNANIDNELTSDLVGDYLFTDQNFINHLHTQDRNVFQKIYDEIKHLIKMVTAGSKEARQLEQLKHSFEKAIRENKASKTTTIESKSNLATEVESNTQEKEIEYSLMGEKGIKEAVRKDSENQWIIDNLDKAKAYSEKGIPSERIRKSTGWFKDANGKWLFEIPDNEIELNRDVLKQNSTTTLKELLPHEDLYEAYGDKLANTIVKIENIKSPDVVAQYNDKTGEISISNSVVEKNKIETIRRALLHEAHHKIQQIEGLENGKGGRNPISYYSSLGEIQATEVEDRSRKDYSWLRENAPESMKEYPIHSQIRALHKALTSHNPESMKKAQNILKNDSRLESLYNEIYKYGEEGVYDRKILTKMGITKNNAINDIGANTSKILSDIGKWFKDRHIHSGKEQLKALDNLFKEQDNKGRTLTKEQEDYFKDSKVRDENGNLLTMYHGTSSGGHTVFDPWGAKVGLFGQGSYFTDNQSVAESYTEKGRGSNKQIYEVYLNITNPIDMDAQGDVQAWAKALSSYGTDIASHLESGTNEQIYRSALDYLAEEGTYDKYERAEIIAETFEKMGYDGITHIGGGRFNKQDGTRHRVYISLDSSQVKNVDNTNPTQDADIRYSLSENVGYHYGDLGKGRDTNYFSMSNTRRSTGHFGTGTYFVGSKDSNVGSLKENRQVHEVDFSNYNVFKPNNYNEAEQLHRLLKDINNGELNAFKLEDSGKLFKKSFEELYTAYKKTLATAEEYKKIDEFDQLQLDSLSTVFMKELGYNGIDVRGIEGFDNGTYGSVIYDLNNKSNPDIRYSLSEKTQRAIDTIGTTTNMEVAGYLTTDGQFIDFSGKHQGARGDKRVMDHREISEIYTDEEYDNAERKYPNMGTATAIMQDFIDDGNIRLISEQGVDITAEPTKEQYDKLYDYLEFLKRRNSEVFIDLETETRNRENLEYNEKTSVSKMINDIKEHYRKYSLSNENTDIAPTNADIFGSEVKLQEQVQEAIAPLKETIQELNNKITELQENIAPIQGYTDEDVNLKNDRNFENLEAQNIAPIENTTPEYRYENSNEITPINDPFESRDIKEVGKKNVKAYMYENPEVKPYFQQTAREMLTDLDNSIKGEKLYLQEFNPATGLMENSLVTGTKRQTTDDIADLLDNYKYTYAEIRKGLNNIIEDNGKENNAVSKRIEFMLHDRLMKGYKSVDGFKIPANEEYRALIDNMNLQAYTDQAYQEWSSNINQDELAPIENASNMNVEAENIPLRSDKKAINQATKSNEPRIEFADPMEAMTRQVGKQIQEGMTYKKSEPKVSPTKKQQAKNMFGKLQDQFINRNYYIDKFAKDTGNKQIKIAGDMVNNFWAEIDGEIFTAQTDNNGNAIGDSLSSLFKKSKQGGYYEAFNDYLMHQSNIDRHKVGKGSIVPLEYSTKMVAEYEKMYPTMRAEAMKVWKYGKNLLANMQSNGLITGQFNSMLQDMYPHYVPFMFDEEVKPFMSDDGTVRPKKAIKRAEGNAYEILEIEDAFAKYTYRTKRAIRENSLYKEIVKSSNEKVSIGADLRLDPTNIEEGLGIDDNGKYYVTSYVDGQMQQATISEDLYNELTKEAEHRVKAMEERYELITKPLQKISEVRRNLLTTWSPTFLITNPIKDIQDAVLNSKYTKDFLEYYTGGLNPLKSVFVELTQAKTKEAKQFLTLYGSGNSMAEYNTEGYTQNPNAKNNNYAKRIVNAVERANNILELAPRFAEFKASLKNGTSVQEAVYNAREVTLNFGRGGYITKGLNRNGFTFLNASVQGFDKLVRNFSGENGAKGIVSSFAKVGMFALAPALINALAFGTGDDEDEDYKALPDYIKDNYYIIKTEDGEFIRIPKGRMLSVFGSAGRRALELLNGDKEAFEGYLTNAYSQVGVQNPLESNIFAPFIQAFGSEAGTTWYGGDLVPTRLQDKPVEEQYDETTDEFSKWLGQMIGVSPYKLNYMLDQYSGGLGDLALPIITEEASSDGSFLAPIKDKFTANTTSDNKYVSEFYDKNDELKVKANSSKATEEDILKNKYMYSVSSEMSELYKEKREVQNDDSLTKEEKYRKVQEIQKQINSLAEEGLNNYERVNKTSNYAMVGDREYYKDANDEWKTPYEDELDELNSLGMDVEEKSDYFNAKNSIYEITEKYKGTEDMYAERKAEIIDVVKNSYLTDDQKGYLYSKYYSKEKTKIINALDMDFDSFLDYESQNFVADKNKYGESINGSKKTKVFDYINSLNGLSFEEKVILAKLEYNSYSEWNYEIIDYLNNLPITYEEEVFVLKKLGFDVDSNGNIFW